jgi:mRNA interferase MazF
VIFHAILKQMQKDFDKWNDKKKALNEKIIENIFFREKEVWWCHLGLNVGFEQDGRHEEFRRPVLVFKKFNAETFWAIPLTTKIKKGKYYFSFKISNLTIISTANLSQIKLVDTKRLIDKIGYMKEGDYEEIKNKIKKIIDNRG